MKLMNDQFMQALAAQPRADWTPALGARHLVAERIADEEPFRESGEAYAVMFGAIVGVEGRSLRPPSEASITVGDASWHVVGDAACPWGGDLSFMFDDGSVATLSLPSEH